MPDRTKVNHIILTPCLYDVDDCYIKHVVPGAHSGWSIDMMTELGEHHGGFRPGDEVAAVVADLFDAYPEAEGKVQARWLDASHQVQTTKAASPMEVCDELMETVADETPDDAENTDDHPLEELRSIMIDLNDLVEAKASGPEGP